MKNEQPDIEVQIQDNNLIISGTNAKIGSKILTIFSQVDNPEILEQASDFKFELGFNHPEQANTAYLSFNKWLANNK